MADILRIEEKVSNSVINIALDTLNIKKQAIVFVNTKRGAEKTAEDISAKIKTGSKELDKLSDDILNALSRPTKQCQRLAGCIKKGIAFHHAGLAQKQRNLIEDSFREGLVKIIASTPTLAMGLDLPAFRAIIRDLKRFGHRGMQPIPVLEYLQMAGRAGRPKYDTYGEAISLADSDAQKEYIHDTFVTGKAEDIFSKLAVEPVLRTYILSLVSANFVNTHQRIVDFFTKTFWAHQYEDMSQLQVIIDRMLSLLEEWEFIRTEKGNSDFVSADSLNDSGKIRATPLGKRVAELYLDPLTANFMMTCLRKASSTSKTPFAFLQMVSNTLEIRPLLRIRVKEYDKFDDVLVTNSSNLLSEEPSAYDVEYEDFMNSIKTASFMNDWIEEKDEAFLLEEYNITPGEIRGKLDIADWLVYSSVELARLMGFKHLISDLNKLRIRMKHGAREELLPLIRFEGIGRVRARKLFSNKIKTLGDVKKARLETLSQILGKKTAEKIKKQAGQEVKVVKDGKRKGQISMNDFS